MSLKIPDNIRESIEKKGGLKKILEEMPSERELQEHANVYSSLGDVIRLKTLCFLCNQSSCVCLLKDVVNLSYSRLSYHLSVMKNSGLINGEKKGNYIIYSLTPIGKRYCREICGGNEE